MAKSNKPLRVAIIGAGGIAGAHLASYAKLGDRVQFVGLADVNEAGMKKYAEKYNIPASALFTDYKEMLRKISPDAVSVCTPNGLHAENSIAASNAGAHVMVEKPMAMNAKEAQAMLDAAKKNKTKLVIGFQWRYDSKTTYLRKAREEGQFGKILYARCQAMRRRGIPNWGVFGRKELQGGGPMIDIGVHIMEVCHFTMGSPKPISAVGNTFTYLGNKKSEVASMWPNWDYKTYTVEDLAVGQIRFDNGAVMTVESSFAGHLKDAWNFVIMGEKGGADWEKTEIYRDCAGHMTDMKPAYLPAGQFADVFDMKIRDFVDHVQLGKPSTAPGEHGLMVQKMLDGIYDSAAKGGREVVIK